MSTSATRPPCYHNDSVDHAWVVVPWEPGIPEHVGCRVCSETLSNQELLDSYLETRRIVESGIAVITGELEQLRADHAAAAGELRVSLDDMPPGSVARRVVVANRHLSNERGRYREQRARLQRAIMLALRATKTHDSVGAADALEEAMIEVDS